jgi:hypothetical protein
VPYASTLRESFGTLSPEKRPVSPPSPVRVYILGIDTHTEKVT